MIDVSVIIPVFNSEKFVANAILSALSQVGVCTEIIVVNDGSIDETEKEILKFEKQVRYFRTENCGPAAARNLGISKAVGTYCAFLDSDDIFIDKDRLSVFIQELNMYSGVEIVMGRAQLQKYDPETAQFLSFNKPCFITGFGTILCRRSIFEDVGLLDEKLFCAEDADWFIRAWEMRKVTRIVDDVMLFYRRHEANITSDLDIKKSFLMLIRRSLKRRQEPKNLITKDTFIGLEKWIIN